MARTISTLLRIVMLHLADNYRPELHYMRGPGPKCRMQRGLLASI